MGPPKGHTQVMYCARSERDFCHLHTHPSVVKMCGYSKDEIIEVIVREGKGYWAWWDEEDQELCFIYPAKLLVEMCFPYGSQAAIDAGKGIVVEVEVVLNE